MLDKINVKDEILSSLWSNIYINLVGELAGNRSKVMYTIKT